METLLPLALYAFVSSITPGPNNLMLTTSGVLFGFLRSIPHMLGITVGFGSLLALCGLGIGTLVLAVPGLQILLKFAGSAYLLYLAWQLRHMSFNRADNRQVKPMSFLGAVAFQFANPKAWMMAITGASAFLPVGQPALLAVLLMCVVFCAINLACISVWAGTGAVLRDYLTDPKWRRLFCVGMAMLTVYAAFALWH